MTFAFGDFSVTTWGPCEGSQLWRVRHRDGRIRYFATGGRDAPVGDLIRLAKVALAGDEA
jgi:hypothetical protein